MSSSIFAVGEEQSVEQNPCDDIVSLGKIKIPRVPTIFDHTIPIMCFIATQKNRIYTATCINLLIDGQGSGLQEAKNDMISKVWTYLKNELNTKNIDDSWSAILSRFNSKNGRRLWDKFNELTIDRAKKGISVDLDLESNARIRILEEEIKVLEEKKKENDTLIDMLINKCLDSIVFEYEDENDNNDNEKFIEEQSSSLKEESFNITTDDNGEDNKRGIVVTKYPIEKLNSKENLPSRVEKHCDTPLKQERNKKSFWGSLLLFFGWASEKPNLRETLTPLAKEFYNTLLSEKSINIKREDKLQFRLGYDRESNIPTILVIVPEKRKEAIDKMHEIACDISARICNEKDMICQFWIIIDVTLNQKLINKEFPDVVPLTLLAPKRDIENITSADVALGGIGSEKDQINRNYIDDLKDLIEEISENTQNQLQEKELCQLVTNI
ncbi:MAG: hypothetical protein LBI42_00940 [Chitinispirillales bacterium]|jgi:hypothetical protein|nr:hypothetical protein [Chitinispirillales bacterium]